jgi:hypothetical protein
MWRKGWAIIEVYPEALEYGGKHGGDRKSSAGGVLDFSYRLVAEETGRDKLPLEWKKFGGVRSELSRQLDNL